MFKKILVALDHSKADKVLLPHALELARLTGAELLLLHVSTGWAAQWQKDLNLSDSPEIMEDREYLQKVEREVRSLGFTVALGTAPESRRRKSSRLPAPSTATSSPWPRTATVYFPT